MTQPAPNSAASVVSTDGSCRAVSAPSRMNSNLPSQKIWATTFSAALVQILVWLYEREGLPPIPVEVSGALTVLVSFAVGYLTPPGSREQVVALIDPLKEPSDPSI